MYVQMDIISDVTSGLFQFGVWIRLARTAIMWLFFIC